MQGGVASSTAAHLRLDQQRPERSGTPDTNSKAIPDTLNRQGPSKNDSRPTTPAGTGIPPAINSASRVDQVRSSSQLPSIRASANLPNRPDGPIPSDRMLSRAGSERAPERPPAYGRHDSRPNEREQYGRLDRPGEVTRERDLIRNPRREPSPGHRSRGRTPEASHPLPSEIRDRRDPGYGPPRDLRDIRDPQYPRDHRPPPRDLMRDGRPEPRPMDWEGSRGRGGSDPRGPPPPHYDDRGRLDGRPDPRSMDWEGPRGRGGNDARGPPPSQYDDRNRPPMRGLNGPPRDQGPPPNAERTAHGRTGSPPPGPVVNSDRLALINQGLNQDRDQDRDRREASRKAELNSRIEKERETGRNQRPSKPSSRPQSPRRSDDKSALRSEPLANDRHNDRASSQPDRNQAAAPSGGRDKRDGAPPAGPLNDQLGRGGAGRGRELIQPQPPTRPPVDPNHGRLNSQGFDPRTQDPNYGRLNASTDVPSGPRGRGNIGGNMGRGGRNFTAPQPLGGTRGMEPSSPAQIPPSPSQDRPPPVGPSSDRDRRDRRSVAGNDQGQAPSSAPQGPAADQGGVHPSRIQQINPPPLQVNVPTGPASHGPSAASPFTPSGPRSGGHWQAPSVNSGNTNMAASSPTSRNPPSGPASGNAGRVKHDVRFEGMKNFLKEAQQGSDRGPIRGRASNTRLNQENTPESLDAVEPSASPAQQELPPPRSDTSQRPDLMADRPVKSAQDSSDAPSDERSDGRGGRRREGGGDRRRSHRSRSRSPRREAVENSTRQRDDQPVRGPPEERRERERRSEGTGSERDERGHRRGRGERDKDREGSGRERGERERREPRGSGGRDGGRNDEQPPRRGPPMDGPGQPMYDGRGPPPPPPPLAPNGDVRGSRGGERHDRDRREPGRDRKRNRGNGEEGGPMDSKRPRRNQ
jgi:THO complex subunit 2